MNRIQHHIWDKLCEMSGEDVARALINWHGNQILDEDFYYYLVDEGLIEDDLGLQASDDNDDDIIIWDD